MGAAGAVELAVSIMSLKHAIIPPTVNVDEVSEGYSPNIRSKSESHQITSVLCNSLVLAVLMLVSLLAKNLTESRIVLLYIHNEGERYIKNERKYSNRYRS